MCAPSGEIEGAGSAPFTGVREVKLIDLALAISKMLDDRTPASVTAVQSIADFLKTGFYVTNKTNVCDYIIYLDGSVQLSDKLSKKNLSKASYSRVFPGNDNAEIRNMATLANGAGYGFIVFKKNIRVCAPHYFEHGPVNETVFPTTPPSIASVPPAGPSATAYDRDVNYLTGGSTGTELAALIQVALWIKANRIDASKVLICYDNNNAPNQVKGIFKPKSESSQQFHKDIDTFGLKQLLDEVDWIWTQSHQGEFGNECANFLAEKGAGSYLEIPKVSKTFKNCSKIWPACSIGWCFPIKNSDNPTLARTNNYFKITTGGSAWQSTKGISPFLSPIATFIRGLNGEYVTNTTASADNWQDWIDCL